MVTPCSTNPLDILRWFQYVSMKGYTRGPSNSLYIRRRCWGWGFEQHVALQDLQPNKQEAFQIVGPKFVMIRKTPSSNTAFQEQLERLRDEIAVKAGKERNLQGARVLGSNMVSKTWWNPRPPHLEGLEIKWGFPEMGVAHFIIHFDKILKLGYHPSKQKWDSSTRIPSIFIPNNPFIKPSSYWGTPRNPSQEAKAQSEALAQLSRKVQSSEAWVEGRSQGWPKMAKNGWCFIAVSHEVVV